MKKLIALALITLVFSGCLKRTFTTNATDYDRYKVLKIKQCIDCANDNRCRITMFNLNSGSIYGNQVIFVNCDKYKVGDTVVFNIEHLK